LFLGWVVNGAAAAPPPTFVYGTALL